MSSPNRDQSRIQHSEQNVLNDSYDKEYGILAVEVVTEKDGKLVRQQEIATDPLASYQLADFDADADPIYIGKVDKEGGWIIKKIEMSSGTALYSKGDSGYNWAGRTGLTYDTFDNIN